MAKLPVYAKPFGPQQAERLLWRAGFGPAPGEAEEVAQKGLRSAVLSLTRPPAEQLTGPAPTDRGAPIAPYDAFGHDHLWWLDRMVRTNRPLVERMTLLWHDWFATSNLGVGSQRLMLNQNQTLRAGALGSFGDLLLAVTRDPAMLLWLSGVKNTLRSPNENYGREMMELFTLGVDNGYTEDDVREQARALTGWRGRRKDDNPADFTFDTRLHDAGTKTIFGKSGTFDWQDSCRLCLQHPNHAGYFVAKLWSYFVATPPAKATSSKLQALYRNGYQVRPVVEAILQHPDLYDGPRMVKPPVVYTAGLLRALGRGVDTILWTRLDAGSGQRLFYPPNVAGWDDTRWLDTATFRGRWFVAALAFAGKKPQDGSSDPKRLVDRAQAALGGPTLTPETSKALLDFAKKNRSSGAVVVEAALRQLLAVSPDLQTS
jgi:uncharacterized protein (DUF1800 family)